MKPSQKTTNNKSKRNSKDKNGKKSQPENCNHSNNHNNSINDDDNNTASTTTPTFREYAGISPDSLTVYAEQSTNLYNLLPEEIDFSTELMTNSAASILTEDINYWLRYVIYNSLVKARLMGGNVITSTNIEETFDNLKIDKVYGATTNPEWQKLESPKKTYVLLDNIVNLSDIIENEITFQQPGEVILTRGWLPQKEISETLQKYFKSMCQLIVNNKDEELRKFALKNISENTQIGPIVEWFYNFSYFLLSKDITYDCLTLNALDLIRTLENSWICRINVTEKKLKLLVRLILQRLLKTSTTTEVLKPMCTVLAVLCYRPPLKEFVLLKLSEKIPEVFDKFIIQVITLINSLGIEAIEKNFFPNIDRFLNKFSDETISQPEIKLKLKDCLMETFNIIRKNNCMDLEIYDKFYEVLGDCLIVYSFQINREKMKEIHQEDRNTIKIQTQLIRTRRQILANKSNATKFRIEDVFEVHKLCSLKIQILYGKNRRKTVTSESSKINYNKKQENIVIGQTSLLLPVLKKYQTNQTITYFYPIEQLSNL